MMTSDGEELCPFCQSSVQAKAVEERRTALAIADKNPVTRDHTLIVPVRHTPDFFSMTCEEKKDADELIQRLRTRIKASDPTVTGFNIGINCGESAGQTIPHAHIHLIPRRDGDTSEPRGGVRGVIPDRMAYPDR
jgi:diadenosine tetraphosphate (Ap4A) HIT family hydrolase